ncbi:MAG: hypothetical protein ABIV06_07610, partial [Thermoanaerobaculia bacterium]
MIAETRSASIERDHRDLRLPGGVLRVARLGLLTGLILSAFGAGGCATQRLGASMQHKLQDQIRASGLDPATVEVPFSATDEMRRWLAAEVPASTRRETQLTWLLQALLNRSTA